MVRNLPKNTDPRDRRLSPAQGCLGFASASGQTGGLCAPALAHRSAWRGFLTLSTVSLPHPAMHQCLPAREGWVILTILPCRLGLGGLRAEESGPLVRCRPEQTDLAGTPLALLECEDREQRRTCTFFLGTSVSEEVRCGT
ncbi:hypothetical protein P7K49_008845 [Saguinus oedipus]|uniref:Uncharacterized protein n=1 Tax=Saguinus oedipus TaxID=9490 RepID=A0ABQ9W0I6_SAGOE|nr:hypothetical protein P7K49_008845 [Saguinus oedipus]